MNTDVLLTLNLRKIFLKCCIPMFMSRKLVAVVLTLWCEHEYMDVSIICDRWETDWFGEASTSTNRWFHYGQMHRSWCFWRSSCGEWLVMNINVCNPVWLSCRHLSAVHWFRAGRLRILCVICDIFLHILHLVLRAKRRFEVTCTFITIIIIIIDHNWVTNVA